MEKIAEILHLLYQKEDAKKALKGIEELLESYRAKISSATYKMSEKDIVLITYADQISSDRENPLATLNKFLKDQVPELNTVHLLPMFPYSSDDGFSVIDYYAVDPRHGGWEDVEKLGSQYRLMFDSVINHISSQSSWVQGYLQNDPEFQDFFIDTDPSLDLTQVVRPRALPLLSPFQTSDDQTKYLWTTFSDDQVDLNYQNYKALLRILDVLLFYVSKGSKLLRLDAIAFAWKEIGTSCIHLNETHQLIKLMREVISQVAPETVIVTETNVPHQENISYFGNGNDEAHMVYNFALPPLLAHAILTGNCEKLTIWAQSLELPGEEVCFFNFTASHDGVGVRPATGILDKEEIDFLVQSSKDHGGYTSMKNNPDGSASPYEINCNYLSLICHPDQPVEERVAKMLLAQGIMLAMPGVPGMYFHSLVGSENYQEGVHKTGMYRSINREKLFHDKILGQINDPFTLRNKLFEGIKKLMKIRISEPAFNPFGEFEFPKLDLRTFCITRRREAEVIHTIFNLSEQQYELNHEVLKGKCLDLISGKTFELGTLQVLPYQMFWLKYNA